MWFAPRRAGWGWAPVTWQGWAAIAVHVGASSVGARALERRHGEAAAIALVVVLSVLLIGLCLLTGVGPGGPKARAAYDREVRSQGLPSTRPGSRPLSADEVRERLRRGSP